MTITIPLILFAIAVVAFIASAWEFVWGWRHERRRLARLYR